MTVTVTTTTPNNASAATIAIIAIDVFISGLSGKGSYLLRISATRLQN
jgi:hypothetical protein